MNRKSFVKSILSAIPLTAFAKSKNPFIVKDEDKAEEIGELAKIESEEFHLVTGSLNVSGRYDLSDFDRGTGYYEF